MATTNVLSGIGAAEREARITFIDLGFKSIDEKKITKANANVNINAKKVQISTNGLLHIF